MAAIPRQNVIIVRPEGTTALWRWDRVRVTQNAAATIGSSGTAADADAALAAARATIPAGEGEFETISVPAIANDPVTGGLPARRMVIIIRTQTNNTNTRWDNITVRPTQVVVQAGGVVADSAGGVHAAIAAAIAAFAAGNTTYDVLYFPTHAF